MDRKEGVSIRLAAPAPPNSFPHNYTLTYVVTLTAHQLSTDVHITNNGDKDFIFQALLHTYLAVPDASKISITGLDKGVAYFDKAGGRQMKQWSGGALTIDKETDALVPLNPDFEAMSERLSIQGVPQFALARTETRGWYWLCPDCPLPRLRRVRSILIIGCG